MRTPKGLPGGGWGCRLRLVRAAEDRSRRPLLERDGERDVLARSVADAAAGRGGAVIIEGPAGIGKSSLLDALAERASAAGVRVVSARGGEMEREFSFGVVRQLFEASLAGLPRAQRARWLAGPAARTAALLDAQDPARPQEQVVAGLATVHALYWLVANQSERVPLLLCVDDVQWADTDSLRFLVHLLPRLDGLAVLVVLAIRPGEPGVERELLEMLVTERSASLLHPEPLSLEAAASVVRTVLAAAGDAFCQAAHAATGGNPLLLWELASMAATERVADDAAGRARLANLGPHVTTRRVALRLSRMGPEAYAVATALAVLGDGAEVADAAALAGLDTDRTFQVIDDLAAAEILRSTLPLSFAHPVVRAAVCEALPPGKRVATHARAARILDARGATPEQVASHLLRVPPAADSWVGEVLQRAGQVAAGHGSPTAALAYFERCLAEPPPDEARFQILLGAGSAALQVSMSRAVGYLSEALELTGPGGARASIADLLGLALSYLGRTAAAVDVLSQAMATLEPDDVDLRDRLRAGILNACLADPALQERAHASVAAWRSNSLDTSVGGRMLDCLIAWYDSMITEPAATCVERGLAALSDGVLIENANGSVALADAVWVLAAADRDEIFGVLAAGRAQAYERGSLHSAALATFYLAQTWLWRGSLVEAESACREGIRLFEEVGQAVGQPLVAGLLAQILTQQGRFDDATDALAWAGPIEALPPTAHLYWLILAAAELDLSRSRWAEAARGFRTVGDRLRVHGWTNPAFLPWGSGAALAQLALGETGPARELAEEELGLARRWAAPRALGRALWVSGLAVGGLEGLERLVEAVAVLEGSPARLEQARALIELGAALRRAGRGVDCREPLRRGIELAQLAGAPPLVERGRTELRASGARPRRVALTGAAALTPSERRVAELAAKGRGNREIAQTLFVTPKTVEVHLTSAYQKLQIGGRRDLARVLAASG
jgi:DNA-binding CsgD family transcriptional regulator